MDIYGDCMDMCWGLWRPSGYYVEMLWRPVETLWRYCGEVVEMCGDVDMCGDV